MNILSVLVALSSILRLTATVPSYGHEQYMQRFRKSLSALSQVHWLSDYLLIAHGAHYDCARYCATCTEPEYSIASDPVRK